MSEAPEGVHWNLKEYFNNPDKQNKGDGVGSGTMVWPTDAMHLSMFWRVVVPILSSRKEYVAIYLAVAFSEELKYQF